jgi:hypothetical protein
VNPILTKNYKAEAALAAYRIVKPGTADNQVVLAAAVGDALIGVTNEVAAAINERADIIHAGIAEIEAGGAITRGDWLTTDANGKAVAAAPAAGVNNNVIGRALVNAASGDIFVALIAPGRIQG